MGGQFSGWYGRRSSRPYFDELPRLSIADYKPIAPGLLTATIAGRSYSVKAVRVSAGCMFAPRLICATCHRACTVLYLHHAACCYRCTNARYRTQSESSIRRALRSAEKIWRQWKHDFQRPEGKPRWMRWPTYERLSAEAEAVFPIIEHAESAPYAAIAKLRTTRRKRGRPRKSTG